MGLPFAEPHINPRVRELEGFVERFERLLVPPAPQEDLAFANPGVRGVPRERNRTVVQLKRRAPATPPVQERPLPIERARIRGFHLQGAVDESLRGVDVPERLHTVGETEDPARVLGARVEDTLEEKRCLVELAFDPKLLALEEDVACLRGVEPEGFVKAVHRVRMPPGRELEVRLRIPCLLVPTIDVEDSIVAVESLGGASHENEELRLLNPEAFVIGVLLETSLDHPTGGLGVTLLEQRVRLLAVVERLPLFPRRENRADLRRERLCDAFALRERLYARSPQRSQVREGVRDRLRRRDRHSGHGVEKLHDGAARLILLCPLNLVPYLALFLLEVRDLRDDLILLRPQLGFLLLNRASFLADLRGMRFDPLGLPVDPRIHLGLVLLDLFAGTCRALRLLRRFRRGILRTPRGVFDGGNLLVRGF